MRSGTTDLITFGCLRIITEVSLNPVNRILDLSNFLSELRLWSLLLNNTVVNARLPAGPDRDRQNLPRFEALPKPRVLVFAVNLSYLNGAGELSIVGIGN
jgi:hypothetical protein